jgi:hypothetical protein
MEEFNFHYFLSDAFLPLLAAKMKYIYLFLSIFHHTLLYILYDIYIYITIYTSLQSIILYLHSNDIVLSIFKQIHRKVIYFAM